MFGFVPVHRSKLAKLSGKSCHHKPRTVITLLSLLQKFPNYLQMHSSTSHSSELYSFQYPDLTDICPYQALPK